MGNYISCTMLGQSRCATVILPTGEIRHFYEAVNAAELMMEHCPDHFLVNTKSLHVGRRFSPLGAVDELEAGHVYAAFAMKRVSSLVSAADMGALFRTASRKNKNAKVLPVDELPKLKLDDIDDFSSPDFTRKLSMCRSRKPLLETIAE